MKKLILLIIATVCSFTANAESKNGIVYVKSGGAGTGTSWSDAMGDIQSAINLAATDYQARKDIWVASGEYTISAAIILADSVNVYGGFAGTEATTSERVKVDAKAWDFTNSTVLKGNNQRLMEMKAAFDMATTVDGFTFTGGNGTGTQLNNSGGAIAMRNNAVIQNCIIKGNTTTGNGGGVNMTGGTLQNCYIADNTGGVGGGIYSNPATSTTSNILNCVIENNTATSTTGGGAIRAQGTAHTYLKSLVIINNRAQSGSTYNPGGAISFNSINCHISNSVIANNAGSNALYLNGGEVSNTTIVNNIGGVYAASTTVAINLINNAVWGCVTTDGTTATGISGTGSKAVVANNNATYTSIPTAYTAAGNITLPSNNTNGETDGVMGPDFIKVTSFKGATADAALIEEIKAANWGLKTGSALIDKGTTVSEITSDIAGITRPQGSAYDIGAYEYTSTPGTGISNNTTNDKVKMYVDGNKVYITNASGTKAEVFNLLGQLIETIKSGDQSFTINQPGTYIVKCGNFVKKILITL